MLNGDSCLWKRLLICKLFSYNYTRIKLSMYFLFVTFICMYYVFGCQHENAFIIFLYFSHTCITTFFLIKKNKTQIDLVDVTLLSDSNCWPLFFRSVFFYFESCTASMTPIELPPKIKIRHVSIQGREWVGVGSVLYIIYLYIWTCLYKNFTKLL